MTTSARSLTLAVLPSLAQYTANPRGYPVAEGGDLGGVLALVAVIGVDDEVIQRVFHAVPRERAGFSEGFGGDPRRQRADTIVRIRVFGEHRRGAPLFAQRD